MGSQGRRTAPMPKGWDRTRQAILRRDNWMCQWDVSTGGKCVEPASEVDHIIPVSMGGGEQHSNLQSLCRWHHAQKTGKEASTFAHAKPPKERPREQHPGIIS
ncbi:HNH endonuclease [Streptomyces sp. NPDC055025]